MSNTSIQEGGSEGPHKRNKRQVPSSHITLLSNVESRLTMENEPIPVADAHTYHQTHVRCHPPNRLLIFSCKFPNVETLPLDETFLHCKLASLEPLSLHTR